MNIKFDEIFGEIDNVWQKRRVYLNHVSILRLKSSVFPTLTQRHEKRNIPTQHSDK